MLDDLGSVAWERLSCTYGTAEPVPTWLRTLTSHSPKARRAAMWQLDNALYHQSTVWTGSVAAIPFFVELLGAPKVGSKDAILDLLSAFMEGGFSGYDAAASRHGGAADAVEDAALGSDDDDTSPEREDAEPQITAVRAGVPVYLALLDDPDLRVQVAAARLLRQCESPTFDPRPALEAAHAREADPAVRAGFTLALAATSHNPAEKRSFLVAAMRSAETREEQVILAAKLAESYTHLDDDEPPPDDDADADESPANESPGIPDDALALLLDALTTPSRHVEKAYGVATGGRDLIRIINLTLYELPRERLRFAVPQLMESLSRIGRERVDVAAGLLLRSVFPPSDGKALPAAALTPGQRAALDALFDAESFWRALTILFNGLDTYGLPESRPLLGDYLGRELPPQDVLGAAAQPQPHRPAPFSLKAYEARIRDVRGYLGLKRKKGYRFERGPEADFYSPDGFHNFYFPRTVEAVLAMEREVALLRSLPRLPLMRWHPGDSSRDTRAIGRVFIGGFCPLGVPLTREALERLRETKRYQQFAVLLARELRELHAVPLDTLSVALPTLHTRATWEQLYAELRARLFDVVPRELRRRIADSIEPFLADERTWTWTPVLVHGDFTPRNILYCPSSDGDAGLASVVGFRHAGLGDPAYDLATLLGPESYGEAYVRHFEGTYPNLTEELERARCYATLLSLRAALAALDAGDRGECDRVLAASLY